ncbi:MULTISPECIES: hypothetical protein [unclassified Streptomyces]|uniref:hypothetical protein n=1 Tax=unclassified Streptomyces TaxID=2593676 RepID=UPI002E78A40D|nr:MULTISPECIES: hypothetical protein [unclassified Streptomyces]MEE1765732.1 hypothetical protein [Streptomyces sp. SP18BB07]MEE1834577.1 hypothetical protein [Streptomyces sp. SP17KL33]
MEDRTKGPASAGTRTARDRRTLVSAAAPLVLFSTVAGALAVGLGALAALLVPGAEARGVVWMVVTALIAAGAGLWWGLTPVTDRLRALDRALSGARPRGPRAGRTG